jgi:hypothetical protein
MVEIRNKLFLYLLMIKSIFSLNKTKQNISDQLLSEYKKYCEICSSLLKSAGKPVEPYLNDQFEKFKNHQDPQRVFKNLKNYTELLQEAISDGDSLEDEKKLLWRMIAKLGYTPSADLLDHIEEEDTIEIYTTDNWQIYRNIKFFDYIDATVDEISTFVWSRDSKREMEVSTEAFRLLFLVKTGMLKNTFKVKTIPPHYASCELSNIKQKVKIVLKIASPLKLGKKNVAYVLTNRSERVDISAKSPKLS